MAAAPNDVLKLLLMAHPDDAVETLFAQDGDLITRLQSQLVHDVDTLQDLIAAERWDLVLARLQVNGATLSGAVDTVRNTNPDIPVIAFEHTPSRDQVVDALRMGAKDMVDVAARDHLRLVMQREMANVRERRARRLLDIQHREFQRQSFALINSVSDPILMLRGGQVLHANTPAIRLCGLGGIDEIRGQELTAFVADRDRSRVRSFLNNLTRGSKLQRIDTALISRDGLPFDVSMSFSCTAFGGREGHLAILRAAAARRDAQQAVYAMSQWDQLTGLHTQRHFLSVLAREMSAASVHADHGALLLIELENFRAMRQTVGIVGSDLLVKDLAAMVVHEIRDAHSIGRFGNHTFAVLLENVDLGGASARAEQLRAVVEQHISEVAGRSLATTCSVAVVSLSAHDADVESLMREAEDLCRQGIAAGGNRIVLARPPVVAPVAIAPGTDTNFSDVIDERRLCVLWQPIVHLHGGQEQSYEVAVAARTRDGTRIDTDSLYASTHDDRELAILDRWLLVQAITSALAERRNNHDVHYFIRLSPAAVTDESTLLHLTRLLRTQGVQRHRLTFQIPERSAHEQVRSARAFANAAQKLYCSTALDGFGTRLTSTHALEQLGVEYVKLGHEHVHKLARDSRRQLALSNLQATLRRMGKTTIATGVADVNTLMVLWQCGVDYAQGDCIQEFDEEPGYDFDNSFEYA